MRYAVRMGPYRKFDTTIALEASTEDGVRQPHIEATARWLPDMVANGPFLDSIALSVCRCPPVPWLLGHAGTLA